MIQDVTLSFLFRRHSFLVPSQIQHLVSQSPALKSSNKCIWGSTQVHLSHQRLFGANESMQFH